MKDYYSLLGIESNATKAEIKKSYRVLATKYHPDKTNDPKSAEKFIEVTEAYDILSNKKSKAQYDLYRWEAQKRKKKTAESFTVVPPPVESTRTRRNKAQRKRSLTYHLAKSKSEKRLYLLGEGLHIFSRYILHLLGLTLFTAIVFSVISQLPGEFEDNIIRGILMLAFVFGFAYVLFKIVENAVLELKKDFEAFSVFYKLPQKKTTNFTLFIFGFLLICYMLLLKIVF
jgi:hypothetical protein